MAKTQDETYSNERTKPFPLTELDFSGKLKGPPPALAPVVGRLWWSCHALPPWVSPREAPCNAVYHACAGNQITGAGIGDVVQFARTQGCDATLVDLSKNLLDDDAALNELTRLVKNYGTFGSQNFLRELLLSSNKIGKAGAPPSPAHRPHAHPDRATAGGACPCGRIAPWTAPRTAPRIAPRKASCDAPRDAPQAPPSSSSTPIGSGTATQRRTAPLSSSTSATTASSTPMVTPLARPPHPTLPTTSRRPRPRPNPNPNP